MTREVKALTWACSAAVTLGALANDKVWVSCTMILPPRAKETPVRPWVNSVHNGPLDPRMLPNSCARIGSSAHETLAAVQLSLRQHCRGLDLDSRFVFDQRGYLDHGHCREMPAHHAAIGFPDLR